MKKRLRKKLHQSHLKDVTYAVSVSSNWREKLFKGKPFEKQLVDMFHCIEIPGPLKAIIKTYNLKYHVYIVPKEEANGWQDWDSDQIFFKFQSAEFPVLIDISANNPNVV